MSEKPTLPDLEINEVEANGKEEKAGRIKDLNELETENRNKIKLIIGFEIEKVRKITTNSLTLALLAGVFIGAAVCIMILT